MATEVKDPEVFLLPPVFATAKTGKRQVWKVWARDGNVYRAFGAVGGKIRTLAPLACTPKNVGAANETSAAEQARLHARREWVKKLDKHYAPAPDDAEGQRLYASARRAKHAQNGMNRAVGDSLGGDANDETKDTANDATNGTANDATNDATKDTANDATNDATNDEFLPMHATVFEAVPKCLKHLDFERGVYAQPKFDGVRCVARRSGTGAVLLTSRTGKRFPHFAAIRAALVPLLKLDQVALDGEIYSHTLFDPDTGVELEKADVFNEIAGAATHARKTPSRFEPQLEYHVFDIAKPAGSLDQDARFAMLDRVLAHCAANGPIVPVKRELLYTPDAVATFHAQVVAEGFEGAILRDRRLRYVPKHRSLQLRKYKAFQTSEFSIVDASEGCGADKGCVIWRCKVDGSDATFDCRPACSRAQRREMYARHADHLGALLTVKYQSLGANGVPRFPVGVGIRAEFEVAPVPF